MTIAFIAVTIRHERRIRLSFSTTLAGAAFTNLAPYVVTNQDGGGSDPTVEAAIVVPNSPNVVELSLGSDLVEGSLYQISAIGVLAADTTVTPNGSVLPFRPSETFIEADTERPQDDVLAAIYGIDLVWSGLDYVEGPDGDLATQTGPQVVLDAVSQRATSEGLPWNANYGAKPRSYVDGPAASSSQLRGSLIRQIAADDRVLAVQVQPPQPDPNDSALMFFPVDVKIVGVPQPQSLQVPIKSA